MPTRGSIRGAVCAYCEKARAVNEDHVIPRQARRRLQLKTRHGATVKKGGRYATAAGEFVPTELLETAPACFACNLRKGCRLLIPMGWSDRLDALNALGIGTFRVWHGDVESLREVVR